MNNELVAQINSLQRQLDGLVKPEVSRWVSWTPNIDQAGAVAATITYAEYSVSGNTVNVQAHIVTTGAGTAGQAITINGIPTAVQPLRSGSTIVIGHGIVVDQGVDLYTVELVANGAASWTMYIHQSGGNFVGVNPNFALANTDIICFEAAYERG